MHPKFSEGTPVRTIPLLKGPLTDLAFDLAQESAGLWRSLPSSLLASLANLVRAMNRHYSPVRVDMIPAYRSGSARNTWPEEPGSMGWATRRHAPRSAGS